MIRCLFRCNQIICSGAIRSLKRSKRTIQLQSGPFYCTCNQRKCSAETGSLLRIIQMKCSAAIRSLLSFNQRKYSPEIKSLIGPIKRKVQLQSIVYSGATTVEITGTCPLQFGCLPWCNPQPTAVRSYQLKCSVAISTVAYSGFTMSTRGNQVDCSVVLYNRSYLLST